MSRRHAIPSGLAAAALVAASVLLATPASANPNATSSLGTFICSDGRTVDVVGMSSPRFPHQVGFVGGKAIVARWIAGQQTASIVFLDGAHAGEPPNLVDATFAGPGNEHSRASAPDLSAFASCTTGGLATYPFTMDQSTADYLGLDSSYVGANTMITENFSETVWINPLQLSKR